jgi:hypothetical protein
LFTVAATPAVETGRGTLDALAAEGASSDPKTERIIPGEYTCWKEAPFATARTSGVPVEVDVPLTLTVTEAVTLLEEPSL